MNHYGIYKLDQNHQILKRSDVESDDAEHAFMIARVFLQDGWLAEVWSGSSKLDVPLLVTGNDHPEPEPDAIAIPLAPPLPPLTT